MNKKQSRGIILFAGFHHTYLTSALGLIATIRNKDKDIPILLYYTEGLMTPEKERVLNGLFKVRTKVLDPKHYTTGGRITFVKSKTRLYELSPFDKTIYLDVDMAFLPRKTASDLFDSLEGVSFTAISEGYFDVNENVNKTSGFYTWWSDKWDIIEKYPQIKANGRLNMLRSEFLYFEKSPEIKKLFALVKQVYEHPLTRPTEIGKALPDEYAFNIATSVLGIHPHKDDYQPVFWDYKRQATHQPIQDEYVIMNKYFAYSIGGNVTTDLQRSIYERLIKGSMNAAGIAHMAFRITDKKDIPQLNRQKL